MNNSDTPTGAIGKKEVKVKNVSDEEMRMHWDDFFEGEELEFNSFYFDVPQKEREINENEVKAQMQMIKAVNVLTDAKYEFVKENVMGGLRKAIVKMGNLETIKEARTHAIMKRMKAKEKNQAEKPDEYKER